jgi:hypothetical protein
MNFIIKNEYVMNKYDVYFSLLKNDKEIFVFHRSDVVGKKAKTNKLTIKDNKIVSKEIVLKEPCLSHNFSIPPDFNFAIAGLEFPKFKKSKYNNRLYTIDFKTFDIKEELPIHVDMENFVKPKLENKNEKIIMSNFDSMISLLKYQDTYYLYTRANVKQGVRNLQYFTSSDFKTWEAKGLVKFNHHITSNDSYYSPYFFKHPTRDLYIGWLTFLEKKSRYSSIRVYISRDCETWEYKNEIFNDRRANFLVKSKDVGKIPANLKSYYFPVYGYWVEDNKFNFMIHHNYFGLIKSEDVKIVHYQIKLEELDEMLNL